MLLNVGGQNVRALLDTGASITVMSANFLQKTCHNGAKLMKPIHQNIKGVTGNYLQVLGMLDIGLDIDNVKFKHRVHVIEDLHHSFILGLDFLTANHANIDFNSNTLTINNNHVCQIITNSGLARTTKSVVIPKRSETTIPVLVSRCKNGDQVLLEPLPSLMKNFHITAAKCLVKVQNRKAYLKILNPTYNDVRLRNNQTLATVVDIVSTNDSATVFSLDCDSATPSHKVASKDADKSHGKSNLHFDLSESDLTDNQKAHLSEFLKAHRDIFSNDLSDLGKTHLYKHKIETLPGSKPVRKQFYRTSPQMAKEIKKQVEDMLQNDIIEPSNSEWHSPVVMVRKKNGQLRFACDYRALNKITIPMSFPLPHLETVFDAIGDSKAQIFTNLDFRSAFWQVEMSPCSKHKAAFITQDGVYEWKRMPFGLMNSPISFQTLMSGVLREMNFKSVLVYIDDVLIFSKDFETHLHDLTQVFSKLRQAGLTLQPSKCHFAVKQLKFLGHVISRHGVEVDSEKTKVVSQLPVPKKQKQVRSFLGMANYYRKFIQNYAKIATPLNALLKKDSIFMWTKECQQAFDTLKKALVSAPILSYPSPDKSFILTCDASDNAIGYYLSQMSDDGKEQVIAYGGKALSKEEKKYCTSEKELLAVVKGVQAYRPYLVGAKFTVYTDHRALVWLKSAKHTGRLERWALKLQEYNYDIIHRPGKSNYVADALSRLSYPVQTQDSDCSTDNTPEVSSVQVDENTENSQSVQVNLFYTANDTDVIVIQEDQLQPVVEDSKQLSQLQRECDDFKHIILYLESQLLPKDKTKHDAIVAESKHYSLTNGILTHFFQRRCKRQQEEDRFITQIALPKVLRLDALRQYHDSLAGGGHLGIEKVRASIIQKYFWPRMHQDIVDYVKSCTRCQLAKRNFNPTKPPMNPMPVKEKFECWQIDILGPLNKSSHGYEYILLCIDAGTRWPEAFPLRSQNAMEVATVLFDNIISRYGAPSILFSDRGRNFMSKVINALCEIFDISQYHTSAYHPNTNGMVERQNSVIAQSLRAYCDKDQKLWPKFLSGIMMSFRKSISANSTEFSPFFLMFGKEMRLPFDVELQPKDNMAGDAKLYIQEFMSNLKIYHEIAKENQKFHQQKNKEKYDKTAKVPDFRVGDHVLMNIHQIPKGLTAKLYDKAQGPYRILRLGPNYTYELKRLSDNKIHPSLVNAIHLKHYYDPEDFRAHLFPNDPNTNQPQGSDNEDEQQSQQDPIQPQPALTDTQIDGPGTAQPVDDTNQPQPQKTWIIKSIPSAKFKNGKRLIRVVWENGDRTWEPDESFNEEMLAEINRKFTKAGKRRKTCMTKPSVLDSQN